SRIFDRRVRENDRRRVLPFLGIGRNVGDKILVRVAVHGVEVAAIRARVGGDGGRRTCERGHQSKQRENKTVNGHEISPFASPRRALSAQSLYGRRWRTPARQDSNIGVRPPHVWAPR